MATVYLDPQYQQFADSLRRELERTDVRLSEYADGLLALSLEAWFKEAPYETGAIRSDANPQDLAREIIRMSVQDPTSDWRVKRTAPFTFTGPDGGVR